MVSALMTAYSAAAFNVVAAGSAIVLRMTLEPGYGIGAGSKALEVVITGIIIGCPGKFASNALTSQRLWYQSLSDIKAAIINLISQKGTVTIDNSFKGLSFR